MSYAEWIERYVSSQPNRFVRGKCAAATKAMVDAFPELRRACGFVYVAWGRDEHWWCVAPDGSVVDPTVSQFPLGVASYEELDPSNPDDVARIPVGKCMNCGEETYRDSYASCVCSKGCGDALDREYREELS